MAITHDDLFDLSKENLDAAIACIKILLDHSNEIHSWGADLDALNPLLDCALKKVS